MDSKSKFGCKIQKHIRKSAANKIAATLLLTCGVLTRIVSGESTTLIFIMMFALPLFFSNKNYIVL